MGSKRRRLFNELNITSPEFKCNKDHYQIIENINKTHIEQLKKELAECSKIEKEESLSQIEDKLIKKRLSDIDFNEQRKLKKATKYVNKEKLKLVLNDLKTPIKLLHEENCSQFDYKEIHWTSPTYIIRHIRNCILNHDWNNLTHLLLLLIKHGEPYICLVKELSLLNFIVNDADYNSELLEDFLQKWFVRVEDNFSPSKYDICYTVDS